MVARSLGLHICDEKRSSGDSLSDRWGKGWWDEVCCVELRWGYIYSLKQWVSFTKPISNSNVSQDQSKNSSVSIKQQSRK